MVSSALGAVRRGDMVCAATVETLKAVAQATSSDARAAMLREPKIVHIMVMSTFGFSQLPYRRSAASGMLAPHSPMRAAVTALATTVPPHPRLHRPTPPRRTG